jgi:hypothetical protein
MRLPRAILTHKVKLRPLAGTSARGATFAADLVRRAHVEERAVLRIDQRTDSATAGTEIQMNTQVIVQLEDYCPPGSRVELADGTIITVANAMRREHRDAPSHAELWGV